MVEAAGNLLVLKSPPAKSNRTNSSIGRLGFLCIFPLAFVSAGAVLVALGFWTSSTGRDMLITAGIVTYILGVLYFVISNLATQSCMREAAEEEDDQQTEDVHFGADSTG